MSSDKPDSPKSEAAGRVSHSQESQIRALEERCRQSQEEVREMARVLEILNETGSRLNSTHDLNVLVQSVTDAATELTGAQFGAFFYNVTNEAGESYTLYTMAGVPRERFAQFELPRATPLFGPTFRGEAVIRADDVTKHPLFGQWGPHHGMPPGHLPVRSYLAVPVVSRSGEVHGGLFFGHEEVGRFSEMHESIVRGIASQAAVAIDNARLVEQLENSQRELQRNVSQRTAALRNTEQQFKQLVTGITDVGIYMLDRDGIVTSWNPGAERIKGYTDTEVIGKHFSIFYTPEDRASGLPERALGIAVREGKFETENWRVRKDGTRFWASILIDPIRDEATGEIIGFAKITRDMTERRAMQEQLHQSQKMEAVGQLTGGVAHDFNNLLTVILGNLERMGRQLSGADAKVRSSLDQVMKAAQRAATLTSQLLAFSRRQPLNPRPTDVNRLVQGMSDLIRRTLGENIAVETVSAAGLWRVDIDPNQLESALLNLAVNARDAMPNGGKLTIETANTHLDEDYTSQYIEVSPGQYVCICISDTGVGMTKEVMDRAFDPFFTTKPIGQGTGLGLSQVFGFVKQSGGHIRLYSEVGQGTTVRIYLPRSRSTAEELDVPNPQAVAVGPHPETILVVEDDDGVRAYTTESLRDLGFSVLEASDGPSALRVLDTHPEIRLMFTDVGLPGMNGRELAERARQHRPDLPILFTTGYARNAIVHQGRLDPGVELITKPFTVAQLGVRVRQILDSAVSLAPGERLALLVDDEPLVRMLLGEMLGEMQFRVVQAATAREALAAAERLAKIELAVIDVGLPDRSGLDVADEFLRSRPNLKVIIASGFGHEIRTVHEAGRVVVLAKPFDSATLRARVKDLGISVED
jgi:PAS domain S-box-containing protein